MTEMRKITAVVPADLLARAQAETGAGISETLRIALQKMAHDRFYRGLQALKGKVFLEIDIEESRADKSYD